MEKCPKCGSISINEKIESSELNESQKETARFVLTMAYSHHSLTGNLSMICSECKYYWSDEEDIEYDKAKGPKHGDK